MCKIRVALKIKATKLHCDFVVNGKPFSDGEKLHDICFNKFPFDLKGARQPRDQVFLMPRRAVDEISAILTDLQWPYFPEI